jgi:cobalt-precorrin 5A hydrolase
VALGETVIIAGLGFRKDISALELERALAAALKDLHIDDSRLKAIAIPAGKGEQVVIAAVAAARGVTVRRIEQPHLEAADARSISRSARAMQTFNVQCVAEAAALAGAGAKARLLAPRMIVGPVTCALAEEGPEA